MVLTNSIFAGRLEKAEMLAAVGLGNVCCMIFFITMFMGLNAAQETLNSQAFGSGNTSLCGIYLNRGLIINIVFFVPMALIPAFYGEQFMLMMG